MTILKAKTFRFVKTWDKSEKEFTGRWVNVKGNVMIQEFCGHDSYHNEIWAGYEKPENVKIIK